MRERLLRRAEACEPSFGKLTFVVLDIGPGRPGWPTLAGSSAPQCPWLYRPGQALVAPPAPLQAGGEGGGPDDRWFAQVWDVVMDRTWPARQLLTV